MIKRLFYSLQWQAVVLLGSVLVFSLVTLLLRITDRLSPEISLYAVQPIGSLLIAIVAYVVSGNVKDRARRQIDKAYIVASVIVVWFVVYFMLGLATTYVFNTLVSSPAAIFLNVFGYTVTAIAMEYTRHRIMQVAGRKNAVWFGVIVALVFSLYQINFASFFALQTSEQFLKLFVSDIVPAVASSFLLTYLAVSAGLYAMLVYRLSIVVVTVLLPIIPKLDWYLIGITSLMLSISVYMVIDKVQQGRHPHYRRHHFHIQRASNGMFIVVMTALILFVTGVLSYKPVVILSDSMKPVYSRGSVVVIRTAFDPMDIEIGDIIQYKHKQNGTAITHRVVGIQQQSNGSGDRVFIAKGDNNQAKDAPIDQSQLMGVIEAEVPFIGYPTIWLRSLL